MARNQETLNKEMYYFLSSNGYDPKAFDTDGSLLPTPNEAALIRFTFQDGDEDLGAARVTIDREAGVTIYFDNDLEHTGSHAWRAFLKQMKDWAMRKQLGFDLENTERLKYDMAQRKYTEQKESLGEGYHAMGKKASYNDNIPAVKIILQHNRQIEEGEQRYRNVAKIFLENTNGERFLAPTTRPGIAQVYARHIAEGGVPNDERWNHIKAICEEYNSMAGFVRATKNKQFNESAQSLVTEGINHYQSLRETLGKLRGHRGYNTYFESWTPALMEDDTDGSQINELFVQETLDPRIESVMPILSRLHKKSGETPVKEVKELEQWADNIVEGEEINEIAPVVGAIAGKALAGAAGVGKIGQVAGSMVGRGVVSAISGNGDEETLEEDSDSSPVESEIIRRIVNVHTELLGKHGPEKVLDAVKEVADYVGDVDEIGSSDISGWIRHVEEILGNQETYEGLDKDQEEANQLGPTEKVGSKGAVGKLVGEAVEHDSPEEDVIMDIVNGNIDVYQVASQPETEAQKKVSGIIQQMYDRISLQSGLHPDDDFEKIYEIIMSELTSEYDPYGQVDEDQMLEDIKRLIK